MDEAIQISEPQDITLENRLEIIDEGIRKKYLARLSGMPIASIGQIPDLEDDIIGNVRMFRVMEMEYKKGEPVTDKFTTVFNTLSTYNATVFALIDSDGKRTDFYLGVRNNEPDGSLSKRSTVTLGDTLKQTLIGHFPGVKVKNEDRSVIAELSRKIASQTNVASVSVVGNGKLRDGSANEQFVQGLEKLVLAMGDRPYMGLIVADNCSAQDVEIMRHDLQELYTKLSPYQKVQTSENYSDSASHSKSFSEMDGRQKAATISAAVTSLGSVAIGSALGSLSGLEIAPVIASMVGTQLSGFMTSIAPVEQMSESYSSGTTTTLENKAVTDMMALVDELLKKTDEYDSYGLWQVAGYFVSDDMSAAEIAASNYRSLMNGERSGREVSAINSWRRKDHAPELGSFSELTTYLSRFVHPRFVYGGNVLVSAATAVSGKELGLHLGLPRATVSGLPVIEHAEFGKEVTTYQMTEPSLSSRPEDRMTIGRIFDLGQVTNKVVELDNKSLNMHTFITGSTGSGKSNAVYQMLNELRQDGIPFLVVEPAKGEYKDVFGHYPDVSVFSTNPNVAPLINLNPFMFPESIHVLEHVDGLVELFSVCWPMYDAMPAFFKDAILRSYEAVGWDLGSSTFEGEALAYPDFGVLAEELDALIGESDYDAEVKSNYRGALLTRVRSLTVGLNKYIFTNEQTSYERLFDQNCILDISRVKSAETKALLMGLMVYILNEYRVDRRCGSNSGLRHVTVLEEAHNLLKRSDGGSSDLVSKSVEMLTNTIAEIRTFGEGFIIVDQSPSAVDVAAIKNTNTKIVLRTPEGNDRLAVGRSMALDEGQIEEIAKLPSGVAVVYQNNWITPVLAKINKADVKEIPYANPVRAEIKSLRTARTELVQMLLNPWLGGEKLSGKSLRADLQTIEADRCIKSDIADCIDDYLLLGGRMVWRVEEIPKLQTMTKAVLGITDADFDRILAQNNADGLRRAVKKRLLSLDDAKIDEICGVLTKVAMNG